MHYCTTLGLYRLSFFFLQTVSASCAPFSGYLPQQPGGTLVCVFARTTQSRNIEGRYCKALHVFIPLGNIAVPHLPSVAQWLILHFSHA